MEEHAVIKSKRIISGIIGGMMLFIMLFSSFYIASEAVHDCCGEDCPVCTCIQLCKNTLQQISFSVSGCGPVVFMTGLILIIAVLHEVFCLHESLISQKIRMND